MTIDLKKLIVLVPYMGGIDKDHLQCMQALQKLGVQTLLLNDCPLIDHARSYMASKALEACPDVEVLMWIDHDIIFEPEDVLKLAGMCLDDHPIIGAPYSTRTPAGFVVGGFEESVKEVSFFESGNQYPATNLGFGFTAVRRTVFEKIGNDLPTLKFVTLRNFMGKPYFANMWRDGCYYGEDKSFIIRAIDAGFQPMLDTSIRLYHKGAYQYGIEDVVSKVGRVPAMTVQLSHVPKD